MRDFDSLIPLKHTWELQTQTPEKRVYEHSERIARIELEMSGDLVTHASLQEQRDGEWVQTARVPSREWAKADQDDHKNELVCHLEISFGRKRDGYSLREPETTDNDNDVVAEDDDAVVIDNTPESTQATFDELLDESDVIDAEDNADVLAD
jgi:hypothetical protein